MGRYLLGFLSAILLIALGLGVLILVDQIGLMKTSPLVLQTVSYFPGLKDLPVSYELGRKQSRMLKDSKEELGDLFQRLQRERQKLVQERSILKAEQEKWRADRLKPPELEATGPLDKGKPNPSNGLSKEDQDKIEQYLATIGSMKPEKAAAVLQKLPVETVLRIFDQAQTRQVVKIMENLPPAYVAQLTQDRIGKYKVLRQ
jgi:flagellar motility protein MotE (MotC chaperone)